MSKLLTPVHYKPHVDTLTLQILPCHVDKASFINNELLVVSKKTVALLIVSHALCSDILSIYSMILLISYWALNKAENGKFAIKLHIVFIYKSTNNFFYKYFVVKLCLNIDI